MPARQPAGTPAGGQFAPMGRTRPRLSLSPETEAEAVEAAYFKTLDSYEARATQFDEARAADARLGDQLTAMHVRSSAYREMAQAAAMLGITPPYRHLEDPPELVAAAARARQVHDLVEELAIVPSEQGEQKLRALLPNLAQENYEHGIRPEMQRAATAARTFEDDDYAAERLVNDGDPQGFLKPVDIQDYRDDDGYDFEAMNSDLGIEWSQRKYQNVRFALDVDWSLRGAETP